MHAHRSTNTVRPSRLYPKLVAYGPRVHAIAPAVEQHRTVFFTERGSITLGSCVAPVFCGWQPRLHRPVFSMSHVFRAAPDRYLQKNDRNYRPVSTLLRNVLSDYRTLGVEEQHVRCLFLAGGASFGDTANYSQWEQNILVTKEELKKLGKAPLHERTGDSFALRLQYQAPALTLLCINHRLADRESFSFNIARMFNT